MQPRFALVTHPLALVSGEENLSPGLLRCRRKIIVHDLLLSKAWERFGGETGVSHFIFRKTAARFEWKKRAWLYKKICEQRGKDGTDDSLPDDPALQRELSHRVLALVDRLLRRMEEDATNGEEKKLDEKTLKNLWAIADSAMSRHCAKTSGPAKQQGKGDDIECLLIRGADPKKIVRPASEAGRVRGNSSRR